MSFFKTAKTTIIASSSLEGSDFLLRKVASTKVASYFNGNPLKADSIEEKLKVVAEAYKISTNPKDYVYVAVRALTADVPNENFDAFTEDELLRFESKLGCQVYQTFILKPHHVNHRSADVTQARGVILDAHYNNSTDAHFPEILIAVDKTKDKRLAEGIASGEITGFSMGCDAGRTVCSICDHEASNPADFCKHIRFNKGQEIEGKMAFEWCKDVTFQEESSVDDPADKSALTQEVILANTKTDVASESEFLIINSKLNNILSKMSNKEGEVTMIKGLERKASTEKKAEDLIPTSEDGGVQNTQEIEEAEKKEQELIDYKEEKNEDEVKETTNSEYGIKEATPSKDKEEIKPTVVEKKDTKKEVSVDTKPVPKVTVPLKKEVPVEKKKASDNIAKDYWSKYQGNYGKEITKDVKRKKLMALRSHIQAKLIEKKKGNPPALFKQDQKSGNPPKGFKFAELYKDVQLDRAGGFLLVSKSYSPIYAISLSAVTPKETGVFAHRVLSSIATKGLNVAMTEVQGIKLQSLYDVTRKPSLVEEFNGDLADTRGREKPKFGIEEGGNDDLQKIDRSKIREKGKGVDQDGINTVQLKASILRKRASDMNELMELMDAEEKKGRDANYILKMVDEWLIKNNPKTSASKKASITDRNLSDFAGADKIFKENKKGIVAEGEDDLEKVKRDSIREDNIWSGGKDDLAGDRKNVVDIKASKQWASIQLSAKKEAEKIAMDSLEEYKQIFRERYLRALKLAGKRSALNLTESPLKIAMADVLLTPTRDYTGMDEQLAVDLIEASFTKGSDAFIESLTKDAESFIDMPEEAFLSIESDANNLNLVIPVQAEAEYEDSVDSQEGDYADYLVEKAACSNPIFSPKETVSGKFDALKAAMSQRFS